MLSYMRKNAASWIIKVLFAVIIIVFVFFYGFSDLRKQSGSGVLAKVGDRKIHTAEYLTAYKNTLQLYRTLYKDQLSDELIEKLGLKQKVLEDLLDREILLQEAERLKVRVAPDTVRAAITSMPVFQENGAFSERLYQRALSQYGIAPTDFERDKEKELVLKMLQDMLFAAVTVSDQEVRDMIALQQEKVEIEYALFSPDRETDTPAADEAALKAYYEKHKETMQQPEKAKVQYILFDPRAFEAQAEVGEDELREFYQAESDRFSEPHRVKARHILFKVEKNAAPEQEQQVRDKAEQVRGRLAKGEDFAKLAQQFSEDTASAAKGGDLGYFKKGDMVKPFEQAAFALKPGETSELVRTPFGFHIIRVEDVKEARVQPFEEARDAIRAELVRDKAKELAEQEAKRAYNRLFKSKDLEAYARDNGLKLLTSDYFAYGAGPEDKPGDEVFSREAFGLEQGELSSAVALGQKFALLKLIEKRPSRIPEFQEVEAEVRAAVAREQREARCRAHAEKALADLRNGAVPWEKLLQDLKLEAKTAEVRRTGDYIADLGTMPDLKEAAFGLSTEQPYPSSVFANEKGAVVVRFKQRVTPGPDVFQKQAEQVRAQLMQSKQREIFEQFLNGVKEKTEIWVDTKRFASL